MKRNSVWGRGFQKKRMPFKVERQQESWEYNNCERILHFFLENGDIAEF